LLIPERVEKVTGRERKRPAILKLSWNSSFFPFPASFLGAASRVAAGNLLGKKEKGKRKNVSLRFQIENC
jgi:hypothetical protein